MHFADLIARKRPTLSFELFPPKSAIDRQSLDHHLRQLDCLQPDFVSVTYGAGGGARERTVELVASLQERHPIPHLTAIGHSREEVSGLLNHYAAAGVANILALRGDPPASGPQRSGDFTQAADLVKFIKSFQPHRDPRGFGIGVAGFPEGHPATPNRMKEMDHLKAKIDAGADYICTQLFFDNHDFYDFRDRCELAGIRVPIIAGILPITHASMMSRMAELAGGTRYPAKLLRTLQRADPNDPRAFCRAGIHHATEQTADLLHHGVAGLHFYTLNQSDAVLRICERLGLADRYPKGHERK
jgi:methylenetetrahydrofolate reductase (NADPH)